MERSTTTGARRLSIDGTLGNQSVMNELVPGVVHWTAFHEGIRSHVSSYYLLAERVLIDPMLPPGGVDWLEQNGPPKAILLTNRHHYRHCREIVDAFGIEVRASRPGMHEFATDQGVRAFDFGEDLPGPAIAHEVGAICPDETALELPSIRAIAFADGLVRSPRSGELGFVPDSLMGDDPEEVKRGLRAAFGRLAELDVEHLLLAHGDPEIGGGQAALRRLAE